MYGFLSTMFEVKVYAQPYEREREPETSGFDHFDGGAKLLWFLWGLISALLGYQLKSIAMNLY